MPTAIERDVYVEAPQATLFAFFTDPEKIARWMGLSHQVEPRPGGIYLVEVTPGNVARGEFREVTPNSRIVYSWGWETANPAVPPGSTEVAIDLVPKPPGTMVSFKHRGLPEPAVLAHTEGWDHYIARLVMAASGGDPGPDPWAQRK